jgi:adenylate cyclase, class 2
MTDLEIEVKFYISDFEPIRRRMQELGAASQGKWFETNLRFEDQNRSLLRKDSLLRLRQDSRNRLTFKSVPGGTTREDDNQFKMYQELEVEVSDFDVMSRILESLGYHAVQTYEKQRETFTYEGLEICVDTLPFGDFLEIEGDKEAIRSMALRLGLNWQQRILENYLGIFEYIRRNTGLEFRDATFSNFQQTNPDDLADYIRHFEAGS